MVAELTLSLSSQCSSPEKVSDLLWLSHIGILHYVSCVGFVMVVQSWCFVVVCSSIVATSPMATWPCFLCEARRWGCRVMRLTWQWQWHGLSPSRWGGTSSSLCAALVTWCDDIGIGMQCSGRVLWVVWGRWRQAAAVGDRSCWASLMVVDGGGSKTMLVCCW